MWRTSTRRSRGRRRAACESGVLRGARLPRGSGHPEGQGGELWAVRCAGGSAEERAAGGEIACRRSRLRPRSVAESDQLRGLHQPAGPVRRQHAACPAEERRGRVSAERQGHSVVLLDPHGRGEGLPLLGLVMDTYSIAAVRAAGSCQVLLLAEMHVAGDLKRQSYPMSNAAHRCSAWQVDMQLAGADVPRSLREREASSRTCSRRPRAKVAIRRPHGDRRSGRVKTHSTIDLGCSRRPRRRAALAAVRKPPCKPRTLPMLPISRPAGCRCGLCRVSLCYNFGRCAISHKCQNLICTISS